MPPSERIRKIPAASIAVVALVLGLSVLAGVKSAWEIGSLGKGMLLQIPAALISFYTIALAGYRAFLRLFPLQEGPVLSGQTEFAYCTYMLFNMFVFFPVLQSSFFLPFPLRRPFYQLLGARLGKNTHCPGVLLDPPLIEFGDHVVIGFESLFSAHAAEADLFVLARVRVGHRASIGARAIVMPGVTIGEGAIVAAGAVVTKGTQIGPRELWGGVPAHRIKMLT
jgi:hypothetical protein